MLLTKHAMINPFYLRQWGSLHKSTDPDQWGSMWTSKNQISMDLRKIFYPVLIFMYECVLLQNLKTPNNVCFKGSQLGTFFL